MNYQVKTNNIKCKTYKIKNKDSWEEAYGLKAFSPIAKTFPFSHFSDFGASRSYGYSRPHLGHDMMSATGTPVIAVESGTIEIMGWNQYGGWRIGIRSADGKRLTFQANAPAALTITHPNAAEGAILLVR